MLQAQDLESYLQIIVFTFPIFLFSLSVHEAAHAITAAWGGDLTSAYQGRVTINPIPHIDIFGTILIPLLGPLIGIPLIGWAKPVPVNSLNLRRGENYDLVVALAGPFSNFLIACFAVVVLQFVLLGFGLMGAGGNNVLPEIVQQFFLYLIFINFALMFFNLIPVPPLDGSWVLWHVLMKRTPALQQVFFTIRQFGMMILLLLLWFGILGIYFRLIVFPIAFAFLDFALVPYELAFPR